MLYRIQLTNTASRQLAGLSREAQESVGRVIDSLAGNPRPYGVRKLQGKNDLFRVRAGPSKAFRVVYEIRDRVLSVVVIAIGDRTEIYRNF